jgi:hypothetical protein
MRSLIRARAVKDHDRQGARSDGDVFARPDLVFKRMRKIPRYFGRNTFLTRLVSLLSSTP